MLKPDYITGLTVLGGEPFEPENQVALVPFLKRVKESYPDKTILVIFRICARDLMREGTHCHTEVTMDMLNMIDVLIDGRSNKNLRTFS